MSDMQVYLELVGELLQISAGCEWHPFFATCLLNSSNTLEISSYQTNEVFSLIKSGKV